MDGGVVWGILIVGWIVYSVIKSFSDEAESKKQIEDFASENKFKSKVTFKNGHLKVEYKGFPNANGYIAHYVTLTDENDFPVQSINPVLTNGEDSRFQLIMPHPDPLSSDTYWPDWVTALPEYELSGKTIRAPRQGKNKIKVTVMITTTDDYRIFATDSKTFQYNQIDRGLLDKVEDTPKIRKQMICFAMAMAFSDGNADKKEAKVVQDWARKKVETETDEKIRNDLKETLNKEIETAYNLGKESKLDINILINNFNKIGDEGDKWELIELLRDVMSADGEADSDELKLLRNLQVQLGMDPEEFNNMMNEAMSKIKTVGSNVTETEDKKSTIENLIGLDPTWSNDQKRAHLAKQNNMFNNLANVAENDEERENANKMLENIAYYRKNYLS